MAPKENAYKRRNKGLVGLIQADADANRETCFSCAAPGFKRCNPRRKLEQASYPVRNLPSCELCLGH